MTECLVFGCSRQSRKSWDLWMCGAHWKFLNGEDKVEARRLNRFIRDNPNPSRKQYDDTMSALDFEFNKMAKKAFEREQGL